MSWLPASYTKRFITDRAYANLSYRLDFDRRRLVGTVDGIHATAQAIQKCILTEQGVHPIYTDYGVKTEDLIGRDAEYVFAVLQKRIRAALVRDNRVLGVTDFTVAVSGHVMTVGFTAKTVYGDIDTLTREVYVA